MTDTVTPGPWNRDNWIVSPEPEDAEDAATYWRQRWAITASALCDAIGVIQYLENHAYPIAEDADGFVACGYVVTIGAVHRAIAFMKGESANLTLT